MARLPDDLARVLTDVTTGRREVSLTGCPPSALPYVLARLQRALGTPALVVVAETERARVVAEALNAHVAPEAGLAAAAVYPELDVSPYAGVSPGRHAAMERIGALFRLSQGLGPRFVVAPVGALGLYTLPRDRMTRFADIVMAGETLDRDRFLRNLTAAGYQNVSVVEDPGTFAVRGGIIDVWPPLAEAPARIDLWGDEVDTVRTFDPETQRSLVEVSELYVSPAREALLDPLTIEHGLHELRRLCDARDVPTQRMRSLSDDLREGILGVGMEFLLPAFYRAPDTLLDYLPDDVLVALEEPEPLRAQLDEAFARLTVEYGLPRTEELLVYPPDRYVRPPDRTLLPLGDRRRLSLRSIVVEEELSGPLHRLDLGANHDLVRDLQHAPGGERSLKPLAQQVRAWQGQGLTCVVTCHTDGQAARLTELLHFYGLAVSDHAAPPRLDALDAAREARAAVHLFRGALTAGFQHPAAGLALVDEEEVFGRKRRQRARRTIARDLVPQLNELTPGDYVVHADHGIGRFEKLEKLTVGGAVSDFLRITYKGGTTLLLPVQNLDRVQRYTGGGGETAPVLDRLGGVAWESRKARVKRAVRDMADELLKLYAARKALDGHACAPPDETFREFEATFPYDETPDQSKAIDEVMDDMGVPAPMDRLVCGDVGYGKTEVAMRAAFRAVADGKQVLVLVPTTVLAEQHRQSFQKRLGAHGVLVDALSRFKTTGEQKALLDRLKRGLVDVVIGTHRLLSRDVEVPRLGLLVIDEEHRFGVAHKERLKQLRQQVDVLTLTATPIPRTLNMALSGLRDLSIIATPPQDRLSVRTMVTRGTDDVVQEGIRRELQRGGQVFFVHNRVQSIFEKAEWLQQLVPEARIGVAHGQMGEKELEKVMLAFVEGQTTVLVTTTIIESGLDIPNANTMFVDRADRFGLAQLYQLRGRIGRSSERAFCYLLIPNPATLDGDARKRIAVIQQFSDLGSGFHIATYDLEIRGSGNLLGGEQSGQVAAVGYDLFLQMLEEAVQELRGTMVRRVDTELKLELPAFLPEEWLPDPNERVRIYRRLAGARAVDELIAMEDELLDRFGAPPDPVKNLVQSLHLKREAGELGVKEVVYGPTALSLTLVDDGPVAPEKLVAFLNRKGSRFRLAPDGKSGTAKVTRPITQKEWDHGILTAREALRELRESAGG
jgi:transcription-repair coupling factor (superfamily II helicase)